MTAVSSPDARRLRLISDGVIASYIHDISARPSSASGDGRGSRAARLGHTRAALRTRDEHHSRASAAQPSERRRKLVSVPSSPRPNHTSRAAVLPAQSQA
jgi:hypothetical protein